MEKERWWTEYFVFSRKERIGILALSFIVAGLWFLPSLVPTAPKTIGIDSAWKKYVNKLKIDSGWTSRSGKSFYPDKNDVKISGPPPRLFYFDPNTIDSFQWRELGLKPKLVKTIRNYLAHGGTFRNTEDLARIYGLEGSEYERLKPFIRIEEKKQIKTNEKYPPARPPDEIRKALPLLDVNLADSAAFESLPGIGPMLAQRIIKFRNKLGGFYTVEQLGETFGLPDSTFNKIRGRLIRGEMSLKKIHLNKATKDELKLHPYLGWQLANAIIEYRNQHGNFLSPEQLKSVRLITEEKFRKLLPYIEL